MGVEGSLGGKPAPALDIEVEVRTRAGLTEFDAPFWARYSLLALWVQARTVLPIGAYMIAFKTYALHLPQTPNFGQCLWAIMAAVLGLAMFLEGLKFGVMPLSEALGKTLPVMVPLRTTLAVAMVLGVGVTFAEPAIGALQTAGATVNVHRAPYLFHLLNAWDFQVVCAVGLGVGVASVVGTLRFVRGWSLKPIIYWVLGVMLPLTAAVHWHAPASFGGVIGLAWDCGAVTTGPVTVPCVIALGVGITTGAKTKADPLSCFGLVTMASLMPVIAVLLLGLLLLQLKTPAMIQREATIAAQALMLEENGAESWQEHSPWKEIRLATRALLPLMLFLWYVLTGYLRQPLPRVVLRSQQSRARLVLSVWPGLAASFAGLCCFNLGLNHGLSRLGQEGGEALPAAWLRLPGVRGSPLYGPNSGILLVLTFVFVLGVGATLAEPALTALGTTVERLSKGTFSRWALAGAVPVGVALGLVLGVLKIMHSVDIAPFIVLLYPAAIVMTHYSTEEFVNIGWDSAGVTTGPVTVPLVLSLGSGLSLAAESRDGFGMLTLSSICPILSVLMYGRWQAGQRTSREREATERLMDSDNDDADTILEGGGVAVEMAGLQQHQLRHEEIAAPALVPMPVSPSHRQSQTVQLSAEFMFEAAKPIAKRSLSASPCKGSADQAMAMRHG